MDAGMLSTLTDGFGLAVFPLPPGGRRPEPGWQKTISLTPGTFPGGSNIGVGCRASRVVVLDVDVPRGFSSMASLCLDGGQTLPVTLAVDTPSGGRHLYFRVGEECVIGSGSDVLGAGIDVRGPGRTQGGYVVGPGSTVGGKPYTVAVAAAVAALPRWLETLLVYSSVSRSGAMSA